MSGNLKHLDDNNFEGEIANGVTLVDFYADWCGPCRMIAPIVEELSNELQGEAKIAKLDIENAQKVTASFGVTSIPTIILFKDGKEVNRVVGIKGKEDLKAMISKAL
ncbi:MAG TPA: thioredoxin [Parachlamydiaceae bacterium]|nr:thioredoxin [Parachlamydiaceae bacterium]